MQLAVVLLICAVVATSANPLSLLPPPGLVCPFGCHVLPCQPGYATGQASGTVTEGVSVGLGGVSKVTSVGSSAGGTASGPDSSSINIANASKQTQSGIFGTSETVNTGATSVQQTQQQLKFCCCLG